MIRFIHTIARGKKRPQREYWGKILYKGKYGNSIYGEPGRIIKTKQDTDNLWWIP